MDLCTLPRLAGDAEGGSVDAVRAMVCFTLGVPLLPTPGREGAWWRRLWYPRAPVGERQLGEPFRVQVLKRTAALLKRSLRAVQQAVWDHQGAAMPAGERSRRAAAEAAAAAATVAAASNRSYMRPAEGGPLVFAPRR